MLISQLQTKKRNEINGVPTFGQPKVKRRKERNPGPVLGTETAPQ
jgi:hypothetical protein